MTDSDFPEAWKPESGDSIRGTVSQVNLSPDFGYGPYPVVTLDTEDGERAVHAYHQILRTELARRRPGRGDEIEIKYLGHKTPKAGGNGYHAYRVSGGKEPEFNWDSELPEGERQTSAASPPILPAPPAPVTVPLQDQAFIAEDDSDVPF